MSSSDAHDGISDADVAALESLWRETAGAPSEAFLNQCMARSRAALTADRQQRASVRFYLTAAAVLLIGWHMSLVAASSLRSRAERSDAFSPTSFADDRRVVLAELTNELALENGAGHLPGNALPRPPLGVKARH